MEDKLTIIVPVYNRENVLQDTIISIENQTLRDFEILVIDDGSTDKSKESVEVLINKYKNIRYIYKENGGVSSARNLGIKNARTKYISFLDSDDLYEKDFVEKMLGNIRKNSSHIAICGCFIEDNNGKYKYRNFFLEKNILYNYIIGRNNFHTSSFVLARDFVIKNNIFFYEDLSWGEDLAFFMKAMSNTSKISLVKEYLTTYVHKADENALSKFEIEKVDKDYKFIDKVVNDKDVKLNAKEKEALVSYKFVGLVVYRLLEALDRGYDIKKVRSYYKKYETYLDQISMKQGMRSIKLSLNKKKLYKKLS